MFVLFGHVLYLFADDAPRLGDRARRAPKGRRATGEPCFPSWRRELDVRVLFPAVGLVLFCNSALEMFLHDGLVELDVAQRHPGVGLRPVGMPETPVVLPAGAGAGL